MELGRRIGGGKVDVIEGNNRVQAMVTVDAVRVTADPYTATLYVDILYKLIETGEERAETFRRTLESSP